MAMDPRQWWGSSRSFIKEVREEMRRVSWPARNEVVGTTAVVLIAVVVFGIFLGAIDFVLLKAMKYIFDAVGA